MKRTIDNNEQKPSSSKGLIIGSLVLTGLLVLLFQPSKAKTGNANNMVPGKALDWLRDLKVWAQDRGRSLAEQLAITIPWMKENEQQSRAIDDERGFSSFDWVAQHGFNVESIIDYAINNKII